MLFVGDDDDYTGVQPDTRKLQWDALDTVEKYMNKEETAPIIPEKEETVIKIVENNLVEPVKIVTKQTQGYENVSNYENALLIGKTDTKQNQTVEQRGHSCEKKQLSKTDSGPIFVPAESISLTTSPPTVPRTTIETPASLSGPRFVQSSITKQVGQAHSSTQPSGPRFSPPIQSSNQTGGSTVSTLHTSQFQEREKDQSTKKDSEPSTLQTSMSQEREKDQSTKKDSEPSTLQTSMSQEREKDQSTKKDFKQRQKFKSVITIGGMNPSIKQGNRAQHIAGGTEGSANRPHNPPNSNDYDMAFPVDDSNRKSLNAVTINSNSSSAVYAVPGKMKETSPANPSNVYAEINTVKQVKGVSKTEQMKSAPKSREYEEIFVTSDGSFSKGKYYWKGQLELWLNSFFEICF